MSPEGELSEGNLFSNPGAHQPASRCSVLSRDARRATPGLAREEAILPGAGTCRVDDGLRPKARHPTGFEIDVILAEHLGAMRSGTVLAEQQARTVR